MQSRLITCGLLVVTLLPLTGCVTAVAVGAAATIMAVEDRRASAVMLKDQSIPFTIYDSVTKRYGSIAVTSTSYNGRVLLTGNVPDQATKDGVSEIVRHVDGVKHVYNELKIASADSTSSYLADSTLTSTVKTKMIETGQSTVHVKVISSNGEVYLMGLVTQAEAEKAIKTIRSIPEVKKVYTYFEYMD